MNPVQAGNDKIQLVLHAEKNVYTIGEPVKPQLQIRNESDRKVELGRYFIFDWMKLAYVEPNFVYLIGPEENNLALPYRLTESTFGPALPVVLESGEEEWLFLPIYTHFHLREPGEYRLFLELGDERGQVYRSNEIGFRLIEEPSLVPPEILELTIESRRSSYALEDTIELEVTFTNNSGKRLVLLRPQEDSFYGWVNPVYQFTVNDRLGRTLALALRSGTMAIPQYDESTQFKLGPGKSVKQILPLPSYPEMNKAGDYSLRLTYLVRENAIGKSGSVLDETMNWPEDVLIGRVESNKITVTLTD